MIIVLLAVALFPPNLLAIGFNSALCNKTSASANGTFFKLSNPHVGQGPQAGQPDNKSNQTLDVGVGITLTQTFDPAELQYSLWYNTNGANYSDDKQLGYDVCALSLIYTPLSTQIRGQQDDGTCYSTLTKECVDALNQVAQTSADQYVASVAGQPNSNTSALALICSDIGGALRTYMPQQCLSFVNASSIFQPAVAITGPGFSPIYAAKCQMHDETGTYELLQTQTSNFSETAYADYANFVSPMMAVWIPTVSGDSPYAINKSVAGMLCGHINEYNEGSVKPPPLMAASTSNNSSTSASDSATSNSDNGLSGGTIAAIVVPIVVGVALIGVLAWFFWRRRQRNQKQKQADTNNQASEKEAYMKDSVTGVTTVGNLSEAPDTAINELPPTSEFGTTQELPVGKDNEVFEMPSEFNTNSGDYKLPIVENRD